MNKTLLIAGGAFVAACAVGFGIYAFFFREGGIVAEQPLVQAPVLKEPDAPRPVILGDRAELERFARIIMQRAGTYRDGDVAGVETLRPLFQPGVFSAFLRVRGDVIRGADRGVIAVTNAVNITDAVINGYVATVVAIGQQMRTLNGAVTVAELKITLEFAKAGEGWQVSKFSF